MGRRTEYRLPSTRPPQDLASGRTVAPGETIPASALDLDDPHDQRLVESVLIHTSGEDAPAGDQLSGRALDDRIKELELTGLSGKGADEKRAAVAERERQLAEEDPDNPLLNPGGNAA